MTFRVTLTAVVMLIIGAPSVYEVLMHSNHMLSKPATIGKVNDKG
jgi:hypothetical protein